MRYEVTSEFGIKHFRKIERMRDFVFQFVPKWLHKLTVYRVRKNGIREVGQFVDDKRVVIFH